jgi:Leucine-rich repeat (LRR) protein
LNPNRESTNPHPRRPQNRLTAVPPSISQLVSLASLRLSDNQLQDGGVPWAALGQLQGLTLLTLDRNRLTVLPEALSACSGLVRLSAVGNDIAAVEGGALAALGALRELDLSENRLAALAGSIGEGVRCSGWPSRRLVAVSPRFSFSSPAASPAAATHPFICHPHHPPPGQCSSLEDLNACANRLAAIPWEVTSLTRLQTLRLSNNRIKTLPDGLFVGCSGLRALLLRDNPITVEALRSAEGFAAYDARRRARIDKQLGGRVMSDVESAFCEGADVEQWQRYK